MAQGVLEGHRMVTLLITSFLLLAGITYAVYRWQRPAPHTDAELDSFPPPRAAALFDDAEDARSLMLESARIAAAEKRRALLARASGGDKEALVDAQASGDAVLYDEVLSELAASADSEQKLLALVSYIARSDSRLRVNKRLAEKFIESWKQNPDKNSTAKMLHTAALADDASLYQAAIEAAYQFWREGRLESISAAELRQLIESEFWLLGAGTRASGAGFVLKRKLVSISRATGER